MIFCDTSTLAKFYVPESESAAIHARFAAEDGIVLSELARVELMGVFHRRLREGLWLRPQFLAAVRQFQKDDTGGWWKWTPLEPLILEQAAATYATLSDKVFLRTADCLHLISALHHGYAEIFTHDAHQIKAGAALGLKPVTLR